MGGGARENPYRPGVGLQPAYLAGRTREQKRFKTVLRGAPGIPANVRLTGLRGVGKTVLLKRLQELAEEAGWATVSTELQPKHNGEQALTDLVRHLLGELDQRLSRGARIRARIEDATEVARRAVKISYDGFEWSLAGDIGAGVVELGELLLDSTGSAGDRGKRGLALLLDEAQVLSDDNRPAGEHPLSTLLSSISALQKQGVPVALVLCGLPTLTVNLLNARTYSERMFQGFEVSSLEPEEAVKAFVEPLRDTGFTASNRLVARVTETVDGYPYFIQLWGAELWDASEDAGIERFDTEILDVIEDGIYKRLDLDFYEPRVEALTPAERDLLVDTAACSYPPLHVSELNGASQKSPENVNVLLGRLVKSNVVYRPRKGEYLYTAPGFREYLLRRAKAAPPTGPQGAAPRLFPAKLTARMSTIEILRKLVADVGSTNVGFTLGLDAAVPLEWLDGGLSKLDEQQTARLRAADRAFRLVARSLGVEEARDWFFSASEDLGYETPATVIRAGRAAEVLVAAADYVAE